MGPAGQDLRDGLGRRRQTRPARGRLQRRETPTDTGGQRKRTEGSPRPGKAATRLQARRAKIARAGKTRGQGNAQGTRGTGKETQFPQTVRRQNAERSAGSAEAFEQARPSVSYPRVRVGVFAP